MPRFVEAVRRKKYREILFSDEKFLTVEESYNKQNDKVYAHSSEEASNRIPRVQRVWLPYDKSKVRRKGLISIEKC
ncbi:hypothetical protein evm_009945 [Chilo suppressalis]|nr:hypothetical protein evm_009945 [Chilo suppressalis]